MDELLKYRRKPKISTNLEQATAFYQTHEYQCRQKEDKNLLSHLQWRVISSRVVARPNINVAYQNYSTDADITLQPLSDDKALPPNCLQLPQSYNWTDGLRTPIKKLKVVDRENYSGMTRDCEQQFSQMLANFHPKKIESNNDPSFSVRRIIKSSGLLKKFGGHIDDSISVNDRTDISHKTKLSGQILNHKKMAEQKLNHFENIPGTGNFNFEEFMNPPVYLPSENRSDLFDSVAHALPVTGNSHFENYLTDLEDEREGKYLEVTSEITALPLYKNMISPVHHPYSSSPEDHDFLTSSPILYDTVVLQKTVETEVVQYLPPSYDIPSPRTSDGLRRKSGRKRQYHHNVGWSSLVQPKRSGYDSSFEEETLIVR